MNTTIRLSERFGSFLLNGDQANLLRFTEIEPKVSMGTIVEIDFDGVTNMTSSFCNALVATLVAHHPVDFAQKVRFKNCDPLIREMILGAVTIGRREAAELA